MPGQYGLAWMPSCLTGKHFASVVPKNGVDQQYESNHQARQKGLGCARVVIRRVETRERCHGTERARSLLDGKSLLGSSLNARLLPTLRGVNGAKKKRDFFPRMTQPIRGLGPAAFCSRNRGLPGPPKRLPARDHSPSHFVLSCRSLDGPEILSFELEGHCCRATKSKKHA